MRRYQWEDEEWVLDDERHYGNRPIVDWSGIIICGAIALVTAFATLALI